MVGTCYSGGRGGLAPTHPSLAVSAIHGRDMCVQAHEKVIVGHGVTEDQVKDAIRIAATFHAAAQALTAGV